MPVKKPTLELIEKPKNKGGRPRKEIDYDTFEKLCQLLPTAAEVASFFGISVDSLDTRLKEKYKLGYSDCLKRFGESAKLSMRRNLMELSKRNAAVAIFLAKNYLGLKDQTDDNESMIDDIVFEEYEEEDEKKAYQT